MPKHLAIIGPPEIALSHYRRRRPMSLFQCAVTSRPPPQHTHVPQIPPSLLLSSSSLQRHGQPGIGVPSAHVYRADLSADTNTCSDSTSQPLRTEPVRQTRPLCPPTRSLIPAFDMSSNPASRALTPSSSKIDLFTLHRSMAPSRSGAGAGERAPLLTQNGEGSVRRNYTMELDASGVTDTSNAGVSGLTGMSGVSGVSGGALASEEGGKDTPRDRERADDRESTPVDATWVKAEEVKHSRRRGLPRQRSRRRLGRGQNITFQ